MNPTEARLSSPIDLSGFRSQARDLLAHQIPPDQVLWNAPLQSADEVLDPGSDSRLRNAPARAASSIVPASFMRLCEYVVQHRDPDRFSLLYRLLWRLVHEPGLRHDPGDVDMARAHHMAHAVRRDIHKLKTNARFREVTSGGDKLNIAWCEPAHHVVETVAPWFAKRNAGTRWALLSPERSVYWDGQKLHYAVGTQPPLSSLASDSDWFERWQSVFYPAKPVPAV
jgi:probable DNA metabolism protein